jgi:hypothetical protein
VSWRGILARFFRPSQSLHGEHKLLSCKTPLMMINYVLLYKIRKRVKKIIKDKIEDEELATTENSCIGCLADDISWEIYYLIKESKE